MNFIKLIINYISSTILKSIFFLFKITGSRVAIVITSKFFSYIGPYTKYNTRAIDNINYIWPRKSKLQKDHILKKMWEILGINIGEFIFLKSNNPLSCKSTKIKGKILIKRTIKANKKKKKGIIFFSAHFGSWEKIPIVLKKLDLEVLCIYRKSNNIFIDKFIQKIRNDLGNYTPKGDQGAKKIFLWLRKGKSVALLMDQKLNEGIKVDFLGKPAYTATAIAELAIRMDLDIVPIKVVRKSINSTEIEFLNKLQMPNKKVAHNEKVKLILKRINLQISDWIKKDPEQWLWIHRRWSKSIYKKK